MLEVIKNSITDGEVCDWLRQNVKKPAADKAALLQNMVNYPKPDDAGGDARPELRKEQAGLAQRGDFIGADEKRD